MPITSRHRNIVGLEGYGLTIVEERLLSEDIATIAFSVDADDGELCGHRPLELMVSEGR